MGLSKHRSRNPLRGPTLEGPPMFRTDPSLPCLRALFALAVFPLLAAAQPEIVPVATGTKPVLAKDAAPVLTEPEAVVELRVLGAKIGYDETDPARPVVKVNLYGASIQDADLGYLASLPALRELNLFGCTKLTDAALPRVAGIKGLRVLSLGRTQVTDAGLKHLKPLTGLQELDLSDTKVRGPCLVHLKGLAGLRKLDLGGTDLSEEGLEYLAGLARLEDLNLYFSNVGDAGLAHLKGLSRLREVNVRGTQVTAAGIRELRAALPRLDVVR
jgi:hypothetical protein